MTEGLAAPRATHRARLAIAARAAIDPTRNDATRQQARVALAGLFADLSARGHRDALRLAQRLDAAFAAAGPLSADTASLVSELLTVLEDGSMTSVAGVAEPRRSLRT